VPTFKLIQRCDFPIMPRATLVKPEQFIFLDAGTTNLEIAGRCPPTPILRWRKLERLRQNLDAELLSEHPLPFGATFRPATNSCRSANVPTASDNESAPP
jgi:DeoR/GlpR family transcriptional regulator of sugar metabolism